MLRVLIGLLVAVGATANDRDDYRESRLAPRFNDNRDRRESRLAQRFDRSADDDYRESRLDRCCPCDDRHGSRPHRRSSSPSPRPRDAVNPPSAPRSPAVPPLAAPPIAPSAAPRAAPPAAPPAAHHSASYLFDGRDDDARVTFFASQSCVAYDGSRGGAELEATGVVGPRSTPGNDINCWQDIAVVCDVAPTTGLALPSGEIKFFSSATLDACSSQSGPTLRFLDDKCEPASLGAHSLNAQCTLPLIPVEPLPGRVTVAFSMSSKCDPAAPRVLQDLRSGVCQSGPQGTGFIVTCNLDGTSSFTFYTDASCATVSYISDFRDQDECLHQSDAFQGPYPLAGSYATRCGAIRA